MSSVSAVPEVQPPSGAPATNDPPAQEGTELQVRRLPTPQTEPPFDDAHRLGPEPDAPQSYGRADDPATQGALALAFPVPTAAPRPDLRLVGLPKCGRRPAAWAAPQPSPTATLPDIRGWAHRFVQAVVEVAAGDRPIRQLSRWASDEVREHLQAHRGQDSAGPRSSSAEAVVRGVVRSIHVGEPRDGVAEVSAVVQRGIRRHAVALRFEGLDGRWLCTALQVG